MGCPGLKASEGLQLGDVRGFERKGWGLGVSSGLKAFELGWSVGLVIR